jgi:hypothetical protein
MEEYLKSTKYIVNSFKPPLVPMTPRKPVTKPRCMLIKTEDDSTNISPIQNHYYDYIFNQTFNN